MDRLTVHQPYNTCGQYILIITRLKLFSDYCSCHVNSLTRLFLGWNCSKYNLINRLTVHYLLVFWIAVLWCYECFDSGHAPGKPQNERSVYKQQHSQRWIKQLKFWSNNKTAELNGEVTKLVLRWSANTFSPFIFLILCCRAKKMFPKNVNELKIASTGLTL